tara:strand:- start:4167 stop:4550 length:384 start_codon:yes stop_codon:yes gene_type:complete
MSIPVTAKDIHKTIKEYGSSTYLISATADNHPHVANLTFAIDKNDLIFTVGKRGTKNLENCPHVTMLWPPKELGGYSLIIDGIASKHENFDGSGSVWKISFDSGILHRPAQNLAGNDDSCGSDCQTI